MKTINKILLMLSGMFALTVMSAGNIHAQIFLAASEPDYVYATNNCTYTTVAGRTGIQNTGNDVLDAAVPPSGPGALVHVSVWDDNYSTSRGMLGWSWNDGTNCYSGTIALGHSTVTDIKDPDVALIYYTNSSNQWRVIPVVVYYGKDGSNYKFYCEGFGISGSSVTCTSITLDVLKDYSTTNQTNHVINIDSDEDAHFAIVWEDDANDIWCNTGSLSGNAPALDCTSPTYINIFATGHHGKTPDVAMHEGNSGTEPIFITFITTAAWGAYAAGDVVVESKTYADVSVNCNWNSPTTDFNAAPQSGYTYSYPRIAANGLNYDALWTVVLQERNAAYYLISGYTHYYYYECLNPPTCTSYGWVWHTDKHIYNDGSTSPGNISHEPNALPVVAYVPTSNNMYIGWTFDNSSGYYPTGGDGAGAKDAIYPVALYITYTGVLECSDYWEVPKPVCEPSSSSPCPGGTSDDYSTLSLACRYAMDNTKLLCTYYFDDNSTGSGNDVFYKLPAIGGTSLRKETAAANTETEIRFAPNPFTSSVEIVIPNAERNLPDMRLTIYDITGKELFAFTGNTETLNVKVAKASTELESGIYLFKLDSPSKQQQWQQKLVKL